jgi:hypothetical protein
MNGNSNQIVVENGNFLDLLTQCFSEHFVGDVDVDTCQISGLCAGARKKTCLPASQVSSTASCDIALLRIS